ncbi:hypothetical protein KP509_02G077100 [Ceratopteris richardii]|uniref:Cyclic nucleotide-binding domain-containing protein n=1 Tax=Ceratopteris richardii TaxID=49495 RepID=A0A8T2V7C6_CERRI|nr:hypothetical protein KP509_02G077100 [Ceratopteris richardii]
MQRTTDVKLRILNYTKHEMHMRAVQAFDKLEEDEDLGPADWQHVMKYLTFLATSDRPSRAHGSHIRLPENYQSHLQDTRVRLLNGVQAAYWTMVEKGRVSQASALILMQSVDEALDAVMKNRTLSDWKGLDPHVRFPSYLRYLWLRNSRIIPRRFLNFLVAERVEFGCIISAAFLRAHRSARCQLREFIGESDIAEVVIKESEAQETAAKTFLEDVRLTFPEVLRVVKTKQVTQAILNELVDYIDGLEKTGLLEGKEINHLHGVVQADLKRLLRNPPSVKVPSMVETLRAHPFIVSQPLEIQEALINSAKEAMKFRNNFLCNEDYRAEGIWLVANGVVQWSNRASAARHFLLPTFSHGSTLGLYEVLTGKPYLCDMRADTVVHCFFIESSHILSALRRRPEVEETYWKESLLAILKILMPERFEGIPLHELRILVMENSIVRVYLKGEVLEFPPGEVGFLLEGFVKEEGKEKMLTAPYVLRNAGDTVESVSSENATYCVESRAHIAILDSAMFHPLLRRASTSQTSSAKLLASAPSFEHEGLMRWPYTRHPSQLSVNSLRRYSTRSLDPQSAYLGHSNRALQTTTKARGPCRSWIENNSTRVRKACHSSQCLTYIRKKNKTTSMLHRPRSEGAVLSQERLDNARTNSIERKNSSSSNDEYDEEEHIIRIDSPSRLFHYNLP